MTDRLTARLAAIRSEQAADIMERFADMGPPPLPGEEPTAEQLAKLDAIRKASR